MQDKSLTILSALFVSSLTIAAVLASKIINIFGLFVPAGILAYSVTFLVSDTIGEIWGKKTANNIVIAGFIALASVFVLIRFAIILPSAPFWGNQEAFSTILSASSRIIIASLIAYLVSQYHDVWLYHFIKDRTGKKHLWLRNNASTAMSQLLDSVIFIVIAFYGVMPLLPLILGQWVIKLIIALIDTPFVYGLVWFLRDREEKAGTAEA
ncbi:MAG: queuosine precursor transporter [Deferribacterales bacterium]